MSMEVDYSKPLTQEERDYLDMRGRQGDIDRVDNAFDVAQEERQVSTQPTGDGPKVMPLNSGESMIQRRARLEEELRAMDEAEAAQSAEVGASDDTEELPYAEWKTQELKNELQRRELPTSGSKPELVRRLEDDDAASGDGL